MFHVPNVLHFITGICLLTVTAAGSCLNLIVYVIVLNEVLGTVDWLLLPPKFLLSIMLQTVLSIGTMLNPCLFGP